MTVEGIKRGGGKLGKWANKITKSVEHDIEEDYMFKIEEECSKYSFNCDLCKSVLNSIYFVSRNSVITRSSYNNCIYDAMMLT